MQKFFNVAGIHPIQINTINIKNLTIYHTLKTPKNTWFITLITHIFSNFMQTLLDSKPNQMRLGRYAFLPLMSGKYINGSHKSLLFLEHKNDRHLGPDMDSLPCCSFQFVNEIPIMLSQNLTIQKGNQQFSLKYMFHTKQNRFNLKSYLYLVLLHYNCNRWSSGTSR